LKKDKDQSVLVFSKTKHGADKIARVLCKVGIGSEAIHGNKSQGARQRALSNFKSGKTRVLIATDIAARGIDINQLELVINYDLPDVPETYVHRIGRTGRAGHTGTALSFCSIEEQAMLRDIQKLTGQKLSTVSV
ncbi:ATP-dependent helicase, partial [Parabacteroides sp. OttesenSCG-928-G07]|nr:ATP-dependent helicase [Parabacteroides sp. OttesenSCG-928-G07]